MDIVECMCRSILNVDILFNLNKYFFLYINLKNICSMYFIFFW